MIQTQNTTTWLGGALLGCVALFVPVGGAHGAPSGQAGQAREIVAIDSLTKAQQAALAAEFAALTAEYDAAMEAFMEEYAEKGAEADFSKYPLETMFDQFAALADRGSVDALRWVLENWNPYKGDLSKPLARALNADARIELASVLGRLHYSVQAPSDAKFMPTALFEVLDGYLAREDALYKAEARLLQARILGMADFDEANVERAVAIYKFVLADEAATKYHSRIQGELNVLVNLRVGKVAPDFVGTDVDGNEIKLSNSRGKVTIVEFWGFW
jgi:hypothetical protein